MTRNVSQLPSADTAGAPENDASSSPIGRLCLAAWGRLGKIFRAAPEQEQCEALDAVDIVLSQMPADMRDRLTSSNKAHRLFERLEGTSLTDVAAVAAAIHDFCAKEGLSGSMNEPKAEPVRSRSQSPGRNEPCSCGSGKKFKKCCMRKGNGDAAD